MKCLFRRMDWCGSCLSLILSSLNITWMSTGGWAFTFLSPIWTLAKQSLRSTSAMARTWAVTVIAVAFFINSSTKGVLGDSNLESDEKPQVSNTCVKSNGERQDNSVLPGHRRTLALEARACHQFRWDNVYCRLSSMRSFVLGPHRTFQRQRSLVACPRLLHFTASTAERDQLGVLDKK